MKTFNHLDLEEEIGYNTRYNTNNIKFTDTMLKSGRCNYNASNRLVKEPIANTVAADANPINANNAVIM